MNLFSVLSKWFWLLAIVSTIANALMLRTRSRPYLSADPSLAEGYEKLFRGYLLWQNVPWVVNGYRNHLGLVCGTIFALKTGIPM